MYSEEAEARAEREEEVEREREDLGLELGDTRVRVKKYDRLRKRKEVTVIYTNPCGWQPCDATECICCAFFAEGERQEIEAPSPEE